MRRRYQHTPQLVPEREAAAADSIEALLNGESTWEVRPSEPKSAQRYPLGADGKDALDAGGRNALYARWYKLVPFPRESLTSVEHDTLPMDQPEASAPSSSFSRPKISIAGSRRFTSRPSQRPRLPSTGRDQACHVLRSWPPTSSF